MSGMKGKIYTGKNPELRAKHNQKNAAVAEKEARAFELHLRGASYTQIAKELDYKDSSSAYKAVHRELDRQRELLLPTKEHREQWIIEHDQALRQGMLTCMAVMKAKDSSPDMKLKAAASLAKMSESIRKLHGMDYVAPKDEPIVLSSGASKDVKVVIQLEPQTLENKE